MFVLVVGLKQIALDFGWPRSVPSLAFSCLFLGTGVGSIVMGYWFDRSGPGPVTGLGMTMIGAGAVLAGMVSAQWQLYAIYGVMMGLLGQAAVIGPLAVNVMRWFEHRRGFAVGLLAAGPGTRGHRVASDLSLLQRELRDWRTTFLWFGVFVLLSALAPHRVPLAAAAGPDPPSRTSEGSESRDRRPRRPRRGASASRTRGCRRRFASPCSRAASRCRFRSGTSSPMRAISAIRPCARRRCWRSPCSRRRWCGSAGGTLVVDRFGGLSALLVFSGIQAVGLVFYALVEARFSPSTWSRCCSGHGIRRHRHVLSGDRARAPARAAESGRRLGMVLLFGAIGMALGGGLGGYRL